MNIFVLLLAFQGQVGSIHVGDKAPDLKGLTYIQSAGKAPSRLDQFKGRVVVLEFWATWCGPCVAAIPHMNDLKQSLSGKPVDFISVSCEDLPVIKKFAAKKKFESWVAKVDPSVFNAYGATAIPQTVIIDAQGKVAGITYPSELSPKHLTNLLNGKPLGISSAQGVSTDTVAKDSALASVADIRVGLSKRKGCSTFVKGGGTKITVNGGTIKDIVATCWSAPITRLELDPSLKDDVRYDFSIVMPELHDPEFAVFAKSVASKALGFSVLEKDEERDAMVISLPDGPKDELSESAMTSNSKFFDDQPTALNASNQTLSELGYVFERYLGKPVVDESGQGKKYDLRIEFKKDDPESFLEALKKCGLILTPAKRVIHLWKVDKG